MWSIRLAAAVLPACGLAGAAEACIATPGFALVHSALPTPLPEGVFIAEVEIDRSTVRGDWREEVRARVRKVIQGDARISRIVLRADVATSCDSPLANGAAGLVLGLPRGRKGRALIVDPITVHRNDGFRLPDGFSVPVECRAKPCPIQP